MMATVQFYRNRYRYPEYGSLQSVGSSIPCTPVGTTLKGGSIRVEGELKDFDGLNYMRVVRDGVTIYAWIDNVSYYTAKVFVIEYSVDAFRTYRSRINFGNQYIERSPIETYLTDPLLGATSPVINTETSIHTMSGAGTRIFVVQMRRSAGDGFSKTPVQPSPYAYYFIEYQTNNWTQNTTLGQLMTAMAGAQPVNLVTMYSLPYMDISSLPTVNLTLDTGSDRVSIPGFKMLQQGSGSPAPMLTNMTPLPLNTTENMEMMRVQHSIKLVIPDAGILNIPDEMIAKQDLALRMDVDLYSGAVNYMLVYDTTGYTTHSVRGSSVSSIPVVSDPLDTYLSQNQNALTTSLIGDVASIAGGLGLSAMGGGLGTALGAGSAMGAVNNIMNRSAQQKDMSSNYSNPPAYLGTAMANNFSGIFWVVKDHAPVYNADIVHTNFGYPYNMINSVSLPSSGYIKLRNCNVSSDGTVPKWALDEVNNIMDNGILFR